MKIIALNQTADYFKFKFGLYVILSFANYVVRFSRSEIRFLLFVSINLFVNPTL
jgi:hypothetical protein